MFAENNNNNNSTNCTNCPAGRFSDIVGGVLHEADCAICPQGFFCAGKMSKEPCGKGTYSNESNLKTAGQCKNCDKGTYSSATGLTAASQCNDCPAGRIGATAGLQSSSECTPTEAGKYNNGEACLQGTYQDQEGQTSCKPCPAGKYGKDSTELYTSQLKTSTSARDVEDTSGKG